MLYMGGEAMSRHMEQSGDYGSAPERAWFQVEQMDGCAVVRAGGEIDAHTVHTFHGIVTQAASLASHVIIDLDHVTFVESSGLGGLIAARNSARERGGSLSLVAPPPMVRRLLGATQLHDIFAIYDSLDEAINAPTQRSFLDQVTLGLGPGVGVEPELPELSSQPSPVGLGEPEPEPLSGGPALSDE
jgi:anti-sigma B factor antagonist